ncbi:MAG: MJ0042-type zinc finger domain-containing protein, partial [Blastopirellula sp. JB062]
MSFIAVCPHCQAKFAAQDHLAGKNVRCPKCKVPFRIGDFVADAAKKTERHARKRPDKRRSSADDLPVARTAKPKPPPVHKPAPNKPAKTDRSKPAPTPSAKTAATTSSAPPPTAKEPPAQPPPAERPKKRRPEKPIELTPAQIAAWETLPPIILATAQHRPASLTQSQRQVDREVDSMAMIPVSTSSANDDLDLAPTSDGAQPKTYETDRAPFSGAVQAGST